MDSHPKQVKKLAAYKWQFKSRFRASAYGWKGTRLASQRLKEAVSEIKKVARADAVAAADGVVALTERIWPALEHIDSSSGALGTAVSRALAALLPVLISAPADRRTRSKWMDRLYDAVCDDGVDYLAPVQDRWGEICGFREVAGEWADRFAPVVLQTWQRREPGAWAVGATPCLSCLLETERYEELRKLLSLQTHRFWHYDKFGAEALVRQGRVDEAIAYAEACPTDRYDGAGILMFCERILLEAGRCDEAYDRYALAAASGSTGVAIFKALVRKYPDRDPREILRDLANRDGCRGKWFAAAKNAGHMDLALDFAHDSFAEPATLIRAARDFEQSDPAFASKVAFCAIQNLLAGGGYEPTPLDILNAHRHLMEAATRLEQLECVRVAVDDVISKGAAPGREDMLKAIVRAARDGRPG